MLQALSAGTGLPLDVPFEQLGARHRRIIMHGCGDQWFDVFVPVDKPTTMPENASPADCFSSSSKGSIRHWKRPRGFRPSLRGRLDHLIDEVECSVCGGSRLRDDAAAVRFQGHTIDELCRLPLGPLQEDAASMETLAA